jgi:hypothetical protein
MKTFQELCKSSEELFFSPFVIENFISPEELEFCLDVYDKSPVFEPASHSRATRKDSQMHPEGGPSKFKEIFLPKLAEVFKDKKIVYEGSNFTEWHAPVSVHTDGYQLPYSSAETIEKNQEILGFAVLVPLRTDTGTGTPGTVMFDQKLYGGGVNLADSAHSKDSSKINDVSLISEYTNKEFDKTDSNYFCVDHLADETLHGFSIDKIIRWNPRDAVVWHRSQFHCSSKFVGFNSKTHLIFFCNYNLVD